MKALVFLLAIVLCVVTCIAQDPVPAPDPVPPEPVVADIANNIKDKADQYLAIGDPSTTADNGTPLAPFNTVDSEAIQQLETSLNGFLNDMKVDPSLQASNFGCVSSDAYFATFSQKVNEAITLFNSGYSNVPTVDKNRVTQKYLEDAINGRIEGFMADVKSAKDSVVGGGDFVPPVLSSYENDLITMVTNYQEEMQALEDQATGTVSVDFDPTKHLDNAVGHGARAVKIEFDWGGVNNHKWLNWSMYNIIYNAKLSFTGNSQAQKDLNALLNMWPQQTEVDAVGEAYADGSIYDTNAAYTGTPGWTAQQSGANGGEFFVDEYGAMITPGEGAFTTDSFYDQQTASTAPVFGSVSDGTYNNRSLGYKYNNGTFSTIKITTNGRAYKIRETIYTSPIVLDMDGDGKLQASKGKWMPHRFTGVKTAEFDMNGDGFLDVTEWVGPNDGLLVDYQGGTMNGKNLFGSSDGRFQNGYEKLSLLDKDADKKLTGDELKTLSIWQDKNSDAKVDSGEIISLEKLGITEIGLKHDAKLVSYFVQNGQKKVMWDWFPSLLRVQRTK